MKKIIDNIKRYERKWVFRNINSLELVIGLLRSRLLFNFQHNKRKVNSLYFDDKNLSSIRENLSIGNKCLIGMNSNVLDDIDNNKVYFGNPAKLKN